MRKYCVVHVGSITLFEFVTFINTYTYAHIHTHTHTQTQTHIDTYAHTHTFSNENVRLNSRQIEMNKLKCFHYLNKMI